jgi:hypothetical protein
MPNPSTIAMYEDGSLVTKATAVIDGVEHTSTYRVTIPALLAEIETLKKQLAEEQTKYTQLDADFNRATRERNKYYTDTADIVGTLRLRHEQMLATVAAMAKKMTEAEESRDRVLRENCDQTVKIRALQAIARAAKEVEDAGTAYAFAEHANFFEDGPPISTALLERNSNATCELEKLLEEHKTFYER